MAVKTATITARPTKCGAKKNVTSSDLNSFLNETGRLIASGITETAMFYGFDFSELSNKRNVKIKGLILSMKGIGYSSSYITYFDINLVSGFNTSGSTVSTYTDLGDGLVSHHQKYDTNAAVNITYTETNFPNAFAWINSNIQALIDGYSNNTFGVRAEIKALEMASLTITIDYEYEEAEDGVKNIYRATNQQDVYKSSNKIQVYKGSNKVYG